MFSTRKHKKGVVAFGIIRITPKYVSKVFTTPKLNMTSSPSLSSSIRFLEVTLADLQQLWLIKLLKDILHVKRTLGIMLQTKPRHHV